MLVIEDDALELVYHFQCKHCGAELYINETLYKLSRTCVLDCPVCHLHLSCKNFDPYVIKDSGIKNHVTMGFSGDDINSKTVE